MTIQPQNPFFTPLKRDYLTEDELDQPIKVVAVKVWGAYTFRGDSRKEVLEGQYEGEVEVPANFNKGHIKLAVNRFIKNEKKGIRARTYHFDERAEHKAVEHSRRVRDFMSDRGLRDNARLKRNYEQKLAERQAQQQAMAAGEAVPLPLDNTQYGADGLPMFSDKTYVAQ